MLEKQLNTLSGKIISKTKELKNVTSQLDNISRLRIIREKGSHFSPSNIKREERYGKLFSGVSRNSKGGGGEYLKGFFFWLFNFSGGGGPAQKMIFPTKTVAKYMCNNLKVAFFLLFNF